jgi:D-alanyl-D-alanine carboxypeptidase/D-alanyl-D-alanine-endopeptidase (penicillin-binding protein 4)
MQNAKGKMHNADGVLNRRQGWSCDAIRPAASRNPVFAFCILHFALLSASACARTSIQVPAPVPHAIETPEASATALSELQKDILATTQLPGVQRGTWGIVVHSLDRNERLFELNARSLLVPASIAKLLAVATAADAVGWDYRFTTTIGVSGPITDGVLRGDLIVDGTGDPSLGGRGGDDMTVLVDAIRAAGIRQVDGRVIGSDATLEDARPALAWAWDDLGYPSGALFGALNFAENRTVVTVTATVPGEPGSLSLDTLAQGRPLMNRTVTVARGATQFVWPEQRPGESALTIAGTVAIGAAPARLNISAGNPTFWFATSLRNHLIAAGIPVTGIAIDSDDLERQPQWTPIYTYRSHPLGELASPMLKESINLYAEAAMRLNSAASASPKTNDTALDGFKMRMTAFGISPDAYQVIDGSGLSRRDAVAPEVFLAVLQRMYDASGASPWMRALPVAGVDGSLDNRMKGTAAEKNVRAKTGTMSNIRSLAGYVTTADGEHLALVVMVNDFEGAGAVAVQAIDAIAARLASFRR